jgi:hypothetical protein
MSLRLAPKAHEAIIVGRVSTPEQGQTHSLDTPVQKCEEWIKDNNCVTGGIYTDSGKSGDDREDSADILKLIHKLHQAGAYRALVEDHYDSRKAKPGSIRKIMAKYRMNLKQMRVRKKQESQKLAEDGRQNSRFPRYGWDDGEGYRIPNYQELRILLLLMKLWNKGKGASLQKIADPLNRLRIPTKTGKQ